MQKEMSNDAIHVYICNVHMHMQCNYLIQCNTFTYAMYAHKTNGEKPSKRKVQTGCNVF